MVFVLYEFSTPNIDFVLDNLICKFFPSEDILYKHPPPIDLSFL